MLPAAASSSEHLNTPKAQTCTLRAVLQLPQLLGNSGSTTRLCKALTVTSEDLGYSFRLVDGSTQLSPLGLVGTAVPSPGLFSVCQQLFLCVHERRQRRQSVQPSIWRPTASFRSASASCNAGQARFSAPQLPSSPPRAAGGSLGVARAWLGLGCNDCKIAPTAAAEYASPLFSFQPKPRNRQLRHWAGGSFPG